MQKGFQFSTPPPIRTDFNIPIFQKTYDFCKELYLILPNFPKRQRYTLGHQLDNLTLEFLELLLEANREQSEKLALLARADSRLETLKIFLRLAKDSQSLDTKKYIHLESYLQEIGKMLGGWIKHAKQIT